MWGFHRELDGMCLRKFQGVLLVNSPFGIRVLFHWDFFGGEINTMIYLEPPWSQ